MSRPGELSDTHGAWATAVVVNDDPTQLHVLTGLLRKERIGATAFESAEAALAGMKPERPPDLIVTDLYMPGIDGWRFCRLLRSPEYEAFNSVPILVVSATFAGDEASRITADLGADAFMSSPVDSRRFLETVRSLQGGEKRKEPSRVLVVEDSKSLAGLLAKRFEEHGYQADVAFSSREALMRFDEAEYDIAVLDYHLPDGLGDALLRQFRVKNRDCICVMITTDPDPKLALSWMKTGAAAYLRKPFDPEYLIEQCVRARRERALLRVEDLLEERTRSLRDREAAVKKRLMYERCISDCVQILSHTSKSSGGFQQVLEIMRKTVYADRSYIFLIEDDSSAGPCMTQIHESCADGVPPQIDNPELQRLPFAIGGPSLLPSLQGNKPFYGLVAEMTGPEREILDDQGVLSVLIVPIISNGTLWGFVGFDDCTTPREWRNEDVRVLQTIAEVMGSTISRRRATESLEKKTREQRLLLDTIDTQVWYLTDIETYGQLNQAHADFLGREVKAIAHKSLPEFVSEEVAEVCKVSNSEVFQTKKPVHTEEWVPNADGEDRLIAITKTPKLDADGHVEYVVCAGTDITERVRLQQRLQTLEKHESLERMTEAIAHLFNNHLAVVVGNLELLADKVQLDAHGSENLREAQAAAFRAAETSGLMITFLGVEQGKKGMVDLAGVCGRRLEKMEEDVPEGAEIVYDLPDSGPIIRADKVHVDQIISALVTNAWESLRKAGEVRVSAGTSRVADIPETHRYPLDWKPRSGDYACLAVADTGCGMNETTIGRIFDPFYTDKFLGRGLGLAVVLGIVKASDGCIVVESEPGRGSRFRVFWPLSEGPGTHPGSGRTHGPKPEENGGAVSLAEDE